MKLDEIARLAGVSRTTASYVINGKAKQYRVSDKTVEKSWLWVREHNLPPERRGSWASCWTHTFYWSCYDPDLENTSYTRIANYLERQGAATGVINC